MIVKADNGMHYQIPDEWAIKLNKYDQIVKVINESNPYHGNRDTCMRIREIVRGNNAEDKKEKLDETKNESI